MKPSSLCLLIVLAAVVSRSMFEAAFAHIERHYLWPDITAQVEAVYLDVLGWETAGTLGPVVGENVRPFYKRTRAGTHANHSSSRQAG